MVMNFLMTAAPLSMHMHGLSQQAANLGIQWHVMAMYGPGFLTGRLIQRFGAVRMAAAGLLITAASVAVGLSGLGVVSLLVVADFARHRLELWLHRRLGENHRFPPPGREDPGSVAQRFSGLRRDDRGVVFVRGSAQRLRLERRAVGLPGPGCGGVVDPAAAPLIPTPRLAPGLPPRRPSFAFFQLCIAEIHLTPCA